MTNSQLPTLECFFCGNKGELPDPPPRGLVAFVRCCNCGMALIVSGDKLHSNSGSTISTGRGKHNSAGAEECLLPKTANPVSIEGVI
jgi:hypothetical protein